MHKDLTDPEDSPCEAVRTALAATVLSMEAKAVGRTLARRAAGRARKDNIAGVSKERCKGVTRGLLESELPRKGVNNSRGSWHKHKNSFVGQIFFSDHENLLHSKQFVKEEGCSAVPSRDAWREARAGQYMRMNSRHRYMGGSKAPQMSLSDNLAAKHALDASDTGRKW